MLRVLSLFAREERPNNRNYNQGYYEADDNKAGTCFNIVHEFITARTKNQSIRRSTYRSCECTGCCNCDSHDNCFRIGAKLFSNRNTNRAQQSCGCSVGHKLGQTARQDKQNCGNDQRRFYPLQWIQASYLRTGRWLPSR